MGPLTKGDPSSVTIVSARPRITEYVDGAVVRVLVCHDGAVGAVRGDIERYCSPVEPAFGATMQTGLGAGDALVVHVRSPAPGVVRVEGVEVTYTSGWQRGTQIAGGTFEATFGRQTVEEHLRDR